MEPQQTDPLRDALKKLPEHQAPEHIWQNLEIAFSDLRQEQALQDGIRKLPEYAPGSSVWYSIEQHLNRKPNKQASIRYLVWWGAAAACVAVVMSLVWFLHPKEKVELQYTVEVLEPTLQMSEDQADEDAFRMIELVCLEKAYLCQNTDFQLLKSELEELNDAKLSLQTVIGQYNTDQNLMAELTRIELDRSEVLKKLIAYL